MSVPTADDHLTQARANRAHAEWLLATGLGDPATLQWAVTATYYSALHGLTAHLMRQGMSAKTHVARRTALQSPGSGVPRHIIAAYRYLEVRSRGARYELWMFTPRRVRDLLDQELAVVAAFVGM